MRFLVDLNVWIAMAFDRHAHHQKARAWFDSCDEGACFFNRMTQQGFLRLSSDRKVLGDAAVPMAGAWRLYDSLWADPRVRFAVEPPRIERHWRDLTRGAQFSPKVWNDAYLGAFALAGDYEIVTFDRGFAQFNLPHCTILE